MGPTKNRKPTENGGTKLASPMHLYIGTWYSVVSIAIQFIFDMKNHNAWFIEHNICRVHFFFFFFFVGKQEVLFNRLSSYNTYNYAGVTKPSFPHASQVPHI